VSPGETSNLCTGFVARIHRLLAPGGELVAIAPRSFCNSPYFQPFREGFLQQMSLRRLHVFDSRQAAFRTDAVLQENIIFHAVRSHGRVGMGLAWVF
jgi:adenine-specific DNA-methyltransferase